VAGAVITGTLPLIPYLHLNDKMWPQNGGQGLVLLTVSVCLPVCLAMKDD